MEDKLLKIIENKNVLVESNIFLYVWKNLII